jgi:hypothetical protein
MICWIPLVTIDDYTPGLELIAKPFDAYLDTARGQYHGVAMAVQESFYEQYKEYMIHPQVRVGDFIMFTPLVPHRTYITPQITDIRTSLDFRFYCGDIREIEGEKAGGY